MENIKIVKPTLANLEEVLKVEKSAWPDIGTGMVAEYEKFKTRIKLGTINLLYLNGEPAGILSYQYPSFASAEVMQKLHQEFKEKGMLDWKAVCKKYKLPKDWYAATNNGYIIKEKESTHSQGSDCVFLIGVGVDSRLKGKGLVNHLLAHLLQEERKKEKKFVLGYGRLPQLHETCQSPSLQDAVEHLLKRKPGTSLPADYGARFHVYNGAEAVAVIPQAMDDPESRNYGFLALYKLWARVK